MNLRRRLLTTAVVLAAVAACARDGATAQPPNAAPAEPGPAMWRLSDADSEIYLFGTFHILPGNLEWTTSALDKAMAATETTMTEVDTKSPQAQAEIAALVQELGLNPPGVTLSATLGPDRAARVAALSEKYGVPMAAIEPLKPWLAMLTLAVLVMQKEGFEADSGAEEVILARAAAEKDAIAHLETPDYQVRVLAGLNEEELLGDFDTSIDQLSDFKGYANRVLTAWSTGDVEALDRETLMPMRQSAPKAFKSLITDRNANWVAEIDRMMKGEGDYFIAVGAGHLVGDGSVVDMLEAKGYDVKRVQ